MQTQWPSTEELMKLAKEDPEALEALRNREVNALIESAPAAAQRRLRGLQFQIDAKRAASKSPMASCMAISEMMFDSVYELNRVLNNQPEAHATPNTTSANADILSFPKALG